MSLRVAYCRVRLKANALAESKCPSTSNTTSREELCPQHGHQSSPSTWHNIVNSHEQDSGIWTNIPQCESTLTFGTDAKNIVTSWDIFNSPTTSSRNKVRHPLYHHFADLKAAQAQLSQISHWNNQHSIREGKLPLDSPKRRLASNIANAIVNLGAQAAAQRGKLNEKRLVQSVIGTPLVLSERPALSLRSSITQNPIKVFQTVEGYQTLSSCPCQQTPYPPPLCPHTNTDLG